MTLGVSFLFQFRPTFFVRLLRGYSFVIIFDRFDFFSRKKADFCYISPRFDLYVDIKLSCAVSFGVMFIDNFFSVVGGCDFLF